MTDQEIADRISGLGAPSEPPLDWKGRVWERIEEDHRFCRTWGMPLGWFIAMWVAILVSAIGGTLLIRAIRLGYFS